MKEYTTLSHASQRYSISKYALQRLIKIGRLRYYNTSELPSKKPVLLVCEQDIEDYQNSVELAYVDINLIPEIYNMSINTARYHILNGNLRWKREGKRYSICREDLDAYIAGREKVPSRPVS